MSLSIGSGINIVGGISVVPATGTTIPDNPIIGSATATGATTATVSFTAPSDNGGSTILSYTATSTPGGNTGTLNQAGSGTITVTGLLPNTSYTFKVTATNSIGTSSPSNFSNSITTQSGAPVNTVAPVVSGTATVGQILSTTDGTWTGSPSITYQWQRAGSNISLATNNTYTLVNADAGNAIRCVVTATNIGGSNSANSNDTANVSAIAPGAPTIGTATTTGLTTATVAFTAPASNGGSTILSYTSTSSPSGITGTLNQAGSGTINMTGLTASTSYTFTVIATNSAGNSSPSSASNSITTDSVPVNTVAPVLSGTQTFGSTLSCTTGTWTGTATITYTYQWQRNGSNIALATNNTYTLVQADVLNVIRCVVTGTNSYGSASANSNSTSDILPIAPGAPTIGTATAISTTSASVTFTAPASNGGRNIQYYTATSNPGNIIGNANPTGDPIYVNGLSQGTSYTFTVTANNGSYTSSPSSASNSITTGILPVNNVAPVLSGTQTFGSTLSCTTGTWTGSPTITYTYQWQRNGSNIALATSNTYVLVQADVLNVIRCVVTGTNSYGSTSANSNSTSDILPIAPDAPTIGTASATGPVSATVTFTAPANNGGRTIQSYTATSSPGGVTGTLNQAGSGTIFISGLNANTSYTFTVTANNGSYTSSPSNVSNSITTNALIIEYLVVGGGGGGGGVGQTGIGAGGGGAGGYRTATGVSITTGVQLSVTVGSGGSRGSSPTVGGNGTASVFNSLSAAGGGGGGTKSSSIFIGTNGAAGGSGGGGCGGADSNSNIFIGGAGNTPSTSPSQGNNGGNGKLSGPDFSGGGGGGAGGVGGTPSVTTAGVGVSNSIGGSAITYSAGGRGGSYNVPALTGVSGTDNTGNGGGGASGSGGTGSSRSGGLGGSGVVIIRHVDTYPTATTTGMAAGYPIISGGYVIYRWNSSGSITF